jgi:hypothetical protein
MNEIILQCSTDHARRGEWGVRANDQYHFALRKAFQPLMPT